MYLTNMKLWQPVHFAGSYSRLNFNTIEKPNNYKIMRQVIHLILPSYAPMQVYIQRWASNHYAQKKKSKSGRNEEA